jgi:hypothetical protein
MDELKEGIGSLSDLVKQDPQNPSDIEIEYKQETRNMTRGQLLNDYGEIIDKLRVQETKMLKEFHEIEQILGKALGFPWFKDDQKNFPNATEADGVCVGDHTAWSLALMAADKIKAWEACAENLVDYAHAHVDYLSCWSKGYDRNDKQIKQAEDAIEEYIKIKGI